MPTLADAFSEMVLDALGYKKLGILRPAIITFGKSNLIFAQWFTVGGASILLVRGAVRDMSVDDYQRWTVLRFQKTLICLRQHLQIVCIAHASHIPAIPKETCRHVFTESQFRMPFNRDSIVVIDPA